MQMDETFARALRDLLVGQVESDGSPADRAEPRRRWAAGLMRPAALALTLGVLVPVVVGGFALVLRGGEHARIDVSQPRPTEVSGSRIAPALSVYAAFRRARRASDVLSTLIPVGHTLGQEHLLTGESRRVLATRTQEWWLVPSATNPSQVCLAIFQRSRVGLGGGSGECGPIGVLHGPTVGTGVKAGQHAVAPTGPFVANLVLPVRYSGLRVRFADGATLLVRSNADGAIAYTTRKHVIGTELVIAPRVAPGGNAVTQLAAPVTVTHTGTYTVHLGRPPAGTTSIVLDLTCLSAGKFAFPGGGSVDCVGASRSGTAVDTVPLTPSHDSTTITAAPGARWRLVATYANVTTTGWRRNASGQTYGEPNQHGTPDLIAVIATNGRSGYAYANTLNSGPGGTAPSTPKQALAENGRSYTITVYRSDGKTPIGKFVTGG